MNMPSVKKNGVHTTNGQRHPRVIMSMAGTMPETKTIKVTPAMASKWLEQNTDSNRTISMRTVQAYAADMTAGKWQVTHQGLAFNKSGELIDGQHRCAAVVMSGVTIETLVTTGMNLEYNAPLDQGYNRSIAHLMGKGSRWVSVVRALIQMEQGMGGGGFKATAAMVEATAINHKAAVEACLHAMPSGTIPTGVVAAMAFAYPCDPNRILSLAQQIQTGELLTKGDPALTLRKWMQQGRHITRENVFAGLAAAKYTLQKKTLAVVVAGVKGETHDGWSNYQWFVMRRRALKIPGTPTIEVVPTQSRGSGKYVEADE